MGRVKFAPNLISFSSSLLGPIFYFYRSVLSYCSIKHDGDDDDLQPGRAMSSTRHKYDWYRLTYSYLTVLCRHFYTAR